MTIQKLLEEQVAKSINNLFNSSFKNTDIQLQITNKEFVGEYTLVVFPYLKLSGKSPEITAQIIGNHLKTNSGFLENYNVIKGFLNLELKNEIFINFLELNYSNTDWGYSSNSELNNKVLVEYSSPNTNKPLHLGHVRNNLLGFSVAQILKAAGKEVNKVNIVNDRGVHICKSMLAYQLFGNSETPESSGLKGDHLVGKYYVAYDKEYKKQIQEQLLKGVNQETAEKEAPILLQVQQMLRDWESGNPEVLALWKKMNSWVYDGFDKTYKTLGVDFDKIYYESQTYLLGKEIVEEGLKKKVFYKKEDGSVWIDLTSEGLDHKVVQRADGTSVYITQDIGTAVLRHRDFNFDELVYVVGNEQDYHFKVLFKILEKLGYAWAKKCYHLSYGMVELPDGKMKSREGTVVDADELIDEMLQTAKQTTIDLGKTADFTEDEANKLYNTIALGALKYFILKVDPKKKMMFNPKESIDFHGNTGPFIQYTYARIQSIFRKHKNSINFNTDLNIELNLKEKELLNLLSRFPDLVKESAKLYSPSEIANYVFDLCREFNQFYHEYPILKEEIEEKKYFRLKLINLIGVTIKNSFKLLGISVPEKM
ncbi:MAG: arginine--tRNA ligase [Bacteroidota bacterium]